MPCYQRATLSLPHTFNIAPRSFSYFSERWYLTLLCSFHLFLYSSLRRNARTFVPSFLSHFPGKVIHFILIRNFSSFRNRLFASFSLSFLSRCLSFSLSRFSSRLYWFRFRFIISLVTLRFLFIGHFTSIISYYKLFSRRFLIKEAISLYFHKISPIIISRSFLFKNTDNYFRILSWYICL